MKMTALYIHKVVSIQTVWYDIFIYFILFGEGEKNI